MIKVVALLCAIASSAYAVNISPFLINGTVVSSGEKEEVVWMDVGAGQCTASIVGKNVILTAAHCVEKAKTVKFEHKGKKYAATPTSHPLYPDDDIDVALAVTTEEIVDAKPMSIGGSASIGQSVELFGYGCTDVGGGDIDDLLRTGTTVVEKFAANDMVMEVEGGPAYCFGDSGGPAMVDDNGKSVILAVASKGNIKDLSYAARLDTTESQDFLTQFVKDNAVEICGVNVTCP